jgi:hypothetical protein
MFQVQQFCTAWIFGIKGVDRVTAELSRGNRTMRANKKSPAQPGSDECWF